MCTGKLPSSVRAMLDVPSVVGGDGEGRRQLEHTECFKYRRLQATMRVEFDDTVHKPPLLDPADYWMDCLIPLRSGPHAAS